MSEDIKVEMKLIKKDWYTLLINDQEIGTYERSQFRFMLSVIDDAITNGLVDSLGDVEIEPMSSEDFMKMIEQGRLAAEEGDDCLACGA